MGTQIAGTAVPLNAPVQDLIDAIDADATNASTYVAADDDETDEMTRAAAQLPRTGASSTTAIVGITGLGLALGGFALRRRLNLI